jgi:hypothetical protein
VTVDGVTLTNGTTGLAGNYTYTPASATTTATITPKTLTLTGVSASDKTYDGNRDATVTNFSIDGFVSGENLGVGGYTAMFDTKDAGTGKTVMIENVTFMNGTNSLASNYSYKVNSGRTTATIEKKIINLDGLKSFDGNVNFDASNFGTHGYIAGVGFETIKLTGTGTVPFSYNLNSKQSLSLGNLSLNNGTNKGWEGNYTLIGGNHFGTIINNPTYIPTNIPPREILDDSDSIHKRLKLQSTDPDDPFVTVGNSELTNKKSR